MSLVGCGRGRRLLNPREDQDLCGHLFDRLVGHIHHRPPGSVALIARVVQFCPDLPRVA